MRAGFQSGSHVSVLLEGLKRSGWKDSIPSGFKHNKKTSIRKSEAKKNLEFDTRTRTGTERTF